MLNVGDSPNGTYVPFLCNSNFDFRLQASLDRNFLSVARAQSCNLYEQRYFRGFIAWHSACISPAFRRVDALAGRYVGDVDHYGQEVPANDLLLFRRPRFRFLRRDVITAYRARNFRCFRVNESKRRAPIVQVYLRDGMYARFVHLCRVFLRKDSRFVHLNYAPCYFRSSNELHLTTRNSVFGVNACF